MAVTLQVGVKVLLRNQEGKYLLLHRSAEKYPGIDGRWDIAGGRIEAGTPLMDNLRREVKEETGLALAEGAPLRLVTAQDILRNPERHVVRLTYLGDAAPGEVTLDMAENDEYRWVTKDELLAEKELDAYFAETLAAIFEEIGRK